ncbi:biotin-dependent carboxyltransferase family protein [Gordonia sp. X0973]|uniref:5-oxoprolinase subunit C family protein n=1 Tax=Gordonia sp. X0973 TaxID=2742602 RepID=UPI00346478E3
MSGPGARRGLAVVATGPMALIEDLGRGGNAHLGVARSGAADREALRLANRLVGNHDDCAGIEAAYGGLALRAIGDTVLAATGAPADLLVDDRSVGHNATLLLRDGQVLRLGAPVHGCRIYVAVRGGIVGGQPAVGGPPVGAVLGSLATDTLSGLGPAALAVGDELHIGDPTDPWPATQWAPVEPTVSGSPVLLTASLGPRADRLTDPAALFTGTWTVNPASNRVGVRLDRRDGPAVEHLPDLPELASEGIAHGSVQIPPSGQPVLFGPDHPVTGGYPVAAVLTAASMDVAGQLTPGMVVHIRQLPD